jgi:hypothetical protein
VFYRDHKVVRERGNLKVVIDCQEQTGETMNESKGGIREAEFRNNGNDQTPMTLVTLHVSLRWCVMKSTLANGWFKKREVFGPLGELVTRSRFKPGASALRLINQPERLLASG